MNAQEPLYRDIAIAVIGFLQTIDWSASSDEWKYARVAEIVAERSLPQATPQERELIGALTAVTSYPEANISSDWLPVFVGAKAVLAKVKAAPKGD